MFFFFFFKQKTAYEMRISDWSSDVCSSDLKAGLVEEAQAKVKEFEQQYLDGLITQGEKYNKVVDVWSQCTDRVADEMMKVIAGTRGRDVNAVFMMADSGARGSAEIGRAHV